MHSEFRVGHWLVQPSMNVISQNSTMVHLEPKVMQVLVCLAKRRGEVVPREDLMRTVWPDTFVTDDVLKRCVSELRRVFEDDAHEPRIIETIPKLGYRLIAPVEEVELTVVARVKQPAEANQGVTVPEAKQSAVEQHPAVKSNLKLLAWSVAGLMVLVAGMTLAYVRGKRSSVIAPPCFHRLTFDRGIIYSARFAPDGQVVYDASWNNRPIRIFTTHAGILQPMPLDLASAHLLDISPTGELALTLNGYAEAYPVFLRGTLARAPMAGGAPRQLLEDVRWADFDSRGELAVVRHSNGLSRLEYPIGKVLYENAGWISHIRVSPQNDRIAFLDHPYWSEDRGSIVVMDLRSQEKKALSTGWESAQGLAWSSTGNEIWFTAAKAGERRDLLAVDLRARQRTVLQVPGGVTLHDISPGGRVLLTVDNERIGTMALTPDGERDLSWSDIGFPRAISPDGKQILLNDQSDRTGSDYWVGLRSIDGSPPIRLGEGWGGNFSPDGKWTVTTVASSPESTFLLPMGTGERKELKHTNIRSYGYMSWFMPDGQTVVIAGIEAGHAPRSYIQSIQGGPAHAVTPEGLIGRLPSPNGRFLVVQQPDLAGIYDIERGESRAIPGTTAQFWPAGWSPDSRYLYMYTRTGPPSQIWRFEISNGQKKLVKQLSPTDAAGILEIFHVQMTPDEKTFVYGYDRYLSELYIVDGLH